MRYGSSHVVTRPSCAADYGPPGTPDVDAVHVTGRLQSSITTRVTRVGWSVSSWCPVRVDDPEDLASNNAIRTRVLGGLHVVGATLALAWLALPHNAGAAN